MQAIDGVDLQGEGAVETHGGAVAAAEAAAAETTPREQVQLRAQVRRAGPKALRIERLLAGAVIAIPTAGLLFAIAWPGAHHAWLRDGILFTIFYLFTGFGITAGYHRLFSHRSFECVPWVRAMFAIAGSMALQGPVIKWVADHRRHHAFSDKEGDPHSPVLGSFLHSHMGWFFQADKSKPSKYAKDLIDDPIVRWVDRNYVWWMVLTLGLPFVLGGLLGGTWTAALSAFLWAGLARMFFVHHVTWAINSVCHVFGNRPYAQARDRSSNVWWIAVPSLGESWHNNHHAFPSSATHGIDRFQIDLSSMLIHSLGAVGLVSDIKEPRKKAKAAA